RKSRRAQPQLELPQRRIEILVRSCLHASKRWRRRAVLLRALNRVHLLARTIIATVPSALLSGPWPPCQPRQGLRQRRQDGRERLHESPQQPAVVIESPLLH
ncbi:unnamed protein product, partial [Scytosiphon promiscuus]